MAKKRVSEVIARRSRRMRGIIILLFGGLMVLQAGIFALVIGLIWGEGLPFWLPELFIGSAFLLVGGALALAIVSWQQRQTAELINRATEQEKQSLDVARNQASALKALAAATGSARDVDRLFDITLDIYQLVLNDLGVPAEDQANVIYLLDDDHLAAAAARGPNGPAAGARLERHEGIAGQALVRAELLVSQRPDQDPALSTLSWLHDCRQVICAPLCTAHGLYGLVMLATREALILSPDETGLLEAIADQVAMALHNFQVRQNIAATRLAYLAAEEDERRLVRQALHEGPSRVTAAVALRLGLIRTMMIKDPGQAAQELGKMEIQTRQASEKLRALVSYLRPLELGIKEFDRAVEKLLGEIEDEMGLALRFGRRTSDKRLSRQTAAVILYVLEGTLTWAGKHGRATAAEINYWPKEDRFYVIIDDDGYGQMQDADQAVARNDALATILMRAKVERLGGRLEVTPKPGRGVSTVLTAPLAEPGLPAEV